MKRKICIMLFVILVVLSAYDAYSTTVLLTSGTGFYEFMPIMRFTMDKIGIIPALVLIKGIFLIWASSFLFRASTKYEWNILTVALSAIVCCYTTAMYFMNYKSMLFLAGGVQL